MSFNKQWAMLAVVGRPCVKRTFGILVVVSATFFAGGVARAQQRIELDFDTSAPRTTAELPDFFDLLGFAPDFGTNWTVDPNSVNQANGSNALHTTSNGNQLAAWFSRVAILKPSVFVGRDVELSADITWDDNDNAGLYVRFNGSSDVPLENEFYHVRGEANGNANSVRLHKVKGGVEEQLFRSSDTVPIVEGATHNLRLRTTTVGDTVEIFVSIDDQPITGMNPFVDAINPISVAGRVGVGQETNPGFYDNIIIKGFDNIFPDFNGDGTVDLADFAIMAANFNTSPTTFEQGDINLDGRVDLRDFLQARRTFNAPVQGALASVPEPAGLTLVLTGMAMIVAARRRRPTVRPLSD